MLRALGFFACYGRFVLVAGLLAGLLAPSLAMALKPWLTELVLLLLFLTAFRVGLPDALLGLRSVRVTLKVVLVYQLGLPLAAIVTFALLGLAQTPVALAITLMLAAPSVTGGPSMATLLGQNPEPSFRLLIVGTALLPLTVLPIFFVSPELGDLRETLAVALRLLLSISGTISAAFTLRHLVLPDMKPAQSRALDGGTALALAVIVIGLMSALGPALHTAPLNVTKWLAVALSANLGLQATAYFTLRRAGYGSAAAPMAIVAGNRNVALFLLASPVAQTQEFLIFLSCYQIPMYLTPIIMRPLLGEADKTAN